MLARHALTDDPLTGNDAPLALYTLYELSYRGFDGVDEAWEWDLDMLALRARLERALLARVRERVTRRFGSRVVRQPDGVAEALLALASGDGPSLSAYMCDRGTIEQMREFAVHRSLYQLKEADPHTWAIPRLAGDAKAALVGIQSDEYGGGNADRMHAELFAATLRALDLDATYGAYIDSVPGTTLSTVNLVSLFGLHRRWRGALIGHLALFEMCSVVPMGRYASALERFGVPDAVPFYAAHVSADEWHQHVALDDMVAGLLRDEPRLAPDVVFGARALDVVERLFASTMLDAWARGESSLYGGSLRLSVA